MTAWGLCPTRVREGDRQKGNWVEWHVVLSACESCEQHRLQCRTLTFVYLTYFCCCVKCSLWNRVLAIATWLDTQHWNRKYPRLFTRVGVSNRFYFIQVTARRLCWDRDNPFTPGVFTTGIYTVSMATASETNRRLLLELLERAGNGTCIDCGVAGKELQSIRLFTLRSSSLASTQVIVRPAYPDWWCAQVISKRRGLAGYAPAWGSWLDS